MNVNKSGDKRGLRFIDMTGMKFGHLTVLYRSEKVGNHKQIYWHCICDCPDKTEKDYLGSALRNGETKSCGCYARNIAKQNGKKNKKYNEYNLIDYKYGVGYTAKGEEFWFDKEDFDKIKMHYWHISNGYAYTNIPHGSLKMHRVVFGLTTKESYIHVDHRNRNRHDNRKENLRFGDIHVDSTNHNPNSLNITGVSGVQFREEKNKKKWVSDISCKNKRYHLGYFETFDEAVKARLLAEKQYFGEYAPQQHLYEQYGII
jgi:hypothetical protein